MLQPDSEDARAFLSWLEKGVMVALQERHLKALQLGAAADAEATQVLEQFEFGFRPGQAGTESDMMGFSLQQQSGRLADTGTSKKVRPCEDLSGQCCLPGLVRVGMDMRC